MLQKTISINNWPLALKVGLPPVLSLATLAIVTMLGLNSLEHQVSTFGDVLNRNVNVVTSLKGVEAELLAIDGEFYNVATSKAANGDEVNSIEAFQTVGDRVDRLIGTIEGLEAAVSDLDNQAGERIGALPEGLHTYKETIGVVAQMMDLDFQSAVSMIDPFRKNYDALIAETRSAISLVEQLSQKSLTRSQTEAESIRSTFIWIGIVSGTIVALASAFIVIGFVRSSTNLAAATAELAAGNYGIDLDCLDRKDELGRIVDSLKLFRTELLQARQLEEQQRQEREAVERERMERLEAEREREKIEAQRQREAEEQAHADQQRLLHRLADDFDLSVNATVEGLQTTAASVLGMVDTVSESAEENNQSSETLRTMVDSVTSSIQSVSSATEQLSISIQEIAQQVDGAAQLSGNAVEIAHKSSTSVASLDEMSQRIGAIVTIINDIAEQTNLLALNATIEAARAGDAGRGFAVVASEVKSLASQTGKATQEIAGQINTMQAASAGVVTMIEDVATVIRQMDEVSSAISSAVEEQGAATQEISRSVNVAADGISEAARAASRMTEIAATNGTAARNMSSAMKGLGQDVDTMKTSVRAFLEEIRN